LAFHEEVEEERSLYHERLEGHLGLWLLLEQGQLI
jgi:hypothetical protein